MWLAGGSLPQVFAGWGIIFEEAPFKLLQSEDQASAFGRQFHSLTFSGRGGVLLGRSHELGVSLRESGGRNHLDSFSRLASQSGLRPYSISFLLFHIAMARSNVV